MSLPEIKYCPGTLAEGFDTYSRTCLKRLFNGKKVFHILPYDSPASNTDSDVLFDDSRRHISISGVQEKYSVILEKNKLRLTKEGERGTYILKPVPSYGNRADQMPANEHLTMQIARQVFGIETAENALVFFKNGDSAYITKRFDVKEDGGKWAQEDFASLAEKTPQTHGDQYKYTGNYLDLFDLMKKYVPAYQIEALKLFRLLMFNYLFSNGDAHLKNFSLLETPMGDFRLSPAYDLLNSRIHIEDSDFALEDGLLPKSFAQGTIGKQFYTLAEKAELNEKQIHKIVESLRGNSEKVERLIVASFLNEKTKRSYLQSYNKKLKRLTK
ncbi:type II toxin-antitoxin system HipA family toxin [Labilibaculum sp.]|uniref:type II toxin-antitoxin system HipA family toxin n=1 Tax=Labilibaculum sp. TaxID=2060723 RepID=UPI003566A431